MSHVKHAATEHPVIAPIPDRWSPYAYEPRSVEKAKLQSLFEAARWAASSYNEQPWVFIVALRENQAEFQKALGCLVEANQAWAKDAGVLILTAYSKRFVRNNTPNRVAEHDLGQAAAHLALQATALGLQAHQMAGIDIAKTRATYSIPEGYEPHTAIAVGYAASNGDPEMLKRDHTPRQRKAFSQFVFAGGWNKPADL